MSSSQGQVLIFLLAVLMANLPFLTTKGFWVVLKGPKSGWMRTVELLAGYAFTGLFGFWVESSVGASQAQAWEFYALTFCLFLVLAFPGFVYRFLWRSPKRINLRNTSHAE